jgi:ribosome-associated protein
MGRMPTQIAKIKPSPEREALNAAHHAVEVASDKQGTDIVLLDVREVSGFADYMVIMSTASARQLNALADDMTDAVKEAGLKLHHREGTPHSGWVLLDFADVLVHLFSEEQRGFYRLEQVWKSGKQLVRIQ